MKRILSCFALAALLITAAAGSTQAITLSPVQVTSNSPGDQEGPFKLCDNRKLVWSGWDTNDREIFRYDRNAKALENISNHDGVDDFRPVTNKNGEIAWYDIEGNIWFYFNNGTGWVTKIISDSTLHGSGFMPEINDNGDVVYTAYGKTLTGAVKGNEDIFLYDQSADTVVQITNDDARKRVPQINNVGDIVWHGMDSATTFTDYEIFHSFFNSVTGTPGPVGNISNNPQKIDWFPQVSDTGWVAWEGEDELGTDFEVYRYALTAGPKENITSDTSDDLWVDVNNVGEVAFQSMGGGLKFYEWNGSTWSIVLIVNVLPSTAFSINNENLSGDTYIVWDQWDGSDDEIWIWSRSITGLSEQVTSNTVNDNNPVINNNGEAAWNMQAGGTLGTYELFYGEKCADEDNDGFTVCDNDCNDNDPAIKPGALEICDGIDNNCSGTADEFMKPYWEDKDGDNEGCMIGSPDQPVACAMVYLHCYSEGTSAPPTIDRGDPNPWVGNMNDCNDTDPTITSVDCISPLYFPSIYDGVDGWKNYITIQGANSADTVNINVYYYNPDGSLAQPNLSLCPTCTNPTSWTILPYTKYNITPNWALYENIEYKLFEGTVVVTSDRRVIGLANALGPNKEAFNIYESAIPRTELYFTKVFDGKVTNNGKRLEWVNFLQIQNVEDTAITVNIDLSMADGTYVATLANQAIPAHGKFEIRPSVIAGYAPFSGNITVTATGGSATGMIKYMYGQGLQTESYSIYEANQQISCLYFPKMYDGFGGNNNYFTILNVNPTPVAVTINLYDDLGTSMFQQAYSLNQFQSINTTPSYLMCGSLGCTDFAGTLQVHLSTMAYGTTNTVVPSVDDPREAFNIYEAVMPSESILFPKVFDGINGWINEISIANVDTVERNLTIDFYDSLGILMQTNQAVIPALGQYNFSPRLLVGAPFNSYVNVTVDTPTKSIGGVMRYEYDGGSLVRAMTIYEGIGK